MKNKAIFYCLIVFIGLGCCKEQQPTSQAAEVVWKTSFGNGLTSSMNPVVYKNIVVYSAYDSSNLKSKLVAFNKETGVKVWEWKNNNQPSGFFPPTGRYVKDNILIVAIQGSLYQVVAINLDSGIQLWHTTLPEAGSFQITGIGNKVFYIRGNNDKMKDEIFAADIQTGNSQSVYAAANSNAPIYIRGMNAYKGKDEKNYLTFLVAKYKDFNFLETESTIFKYSIDSSKVVYSKKLDFIDKKNNSPFLADVTSNKLWLRGSPVYTLDEITGEKLLDITPPFPEVLSGNMAIFDNKIFMPRTQTLICFDGETGKQLWVENGQSSGSTNRFQAFNGVLYFAGRGDGSLHAFDILTGTQIWKVESPDKKQDSAGFDAIVTVDSSTNRLYTATYLSAVCYKTAR